VTRVIHGQKQSSSPPKKGAAKYMLPQESTLKTRPTHILKQDRSQSVSPEKSTLKIRPTHQLKQERPQSVSPEESKVK
jgi:hypothetical protein